MKDILQTIGKILGFCFAGLVIGYTALLTWMLAQRLIPDNVILQFMTLALFDGGAITWFVMFITQAKGTAQWAVAGIGFIVGLLGAIIMAAGELVLGQQLVVLEDPTKLGWILVMTVVCAALAHATFIYAFHFLDPNTRNRIENAQLVSKQLEKANTDVRAEITRDSDKFTAQYRQSIMAEAMQQISEQTALHIRNAGKLEERTGEILRGGSVIDASVTDPMSKPVFHNVPFKPPERVFAKDVPAVTPPPPDNSNGKFPKASRGKAQ